MDRDTGKFKKVKYTRSELIKMLAEKNIIAQGNLKKIQEIARNSDVPIEQDKPIIEEGWVGKPKGMMQLLYERSFLDSTKLDLYTLNGKKDKYGHTIPNKRNDEFFGGFFGRGNLATVPWQITWRDSRPNTKMSPRNCR